MCHKRGLLRTERPNHSPTVRAVGEHIKFNKATEAEGLLRKATPFYEKKRQESSTYGIAFQAKLMSSSHLPETLSRVTLALLDSVFQTKKLKNKS